MVNSIADLVHDSSFYRIEGLINCNTFLKIEGFNPAGSIKLKTALGLINDLENNGRITQDTILIESSSGNLGVAISAVAAERGYRFVCVVDPNTSAQNIKMIKALGAEVIVVAKRDANGGFLETRINTIKDIVAGDPRFLWLNQYANPENPRVHARTTAASITRQFSRVDYLFVGAGTTGTLMGCLNHFRLNRPKTCVVAVDSVGSVTFGHKAGKRYIPGLGTSRIPEIFDASKLMHTQMVPEAETVAMCRYLARNHGLLLGGSSGTVLAGALHWQHAFCPDDVIVVICPDLGERYLDTVYDDEWIRDRFGETSLNGLIKPRQNLAHST